MKHTLIKIIKFLSENEYYFCINSGELHQEIDECDCVDSLLQNVYDRIYVSVCDLLDGYRIDPKHDLKDEIQEQIINEAFEQAERLHIRFNNLNNQEIIEHVNNNTELKQLLFDRFTETAHK